MPCSCLLAFCSAAPARLLCSSARFCSSSRVSPSTLRACALAWSTTAPACSVAASFRSDAFDKASSFTCSGAPELGALWVSVGAVVMSYSSIRLLIADGYPSASGRNNERPAKHSTQRLDHPTRHSRQIERRNKVWFTRAGGYSVPTGHQEDPMFCPRCRSTTTVVHPPTATAVAVPPVRNCRNCGTRLEAPHHE